MLFSLAGRDLTRAPGYPAREGEKSTAAGGGKREIFRVAATWLLPTELRRVRKAKALVATVQTKSLATLCENLSFSAETNLIKKPPDLI